MELFRTTRSRRIIFGIIIGVVVLLVAGRAYLPLYIRDQLNVKLADLGDYRGHIDDVDLHLWRAGISFHGVEVVKKKSNVGAKLFTTDSIDAMLHWKTLLQLRIVAQIDFYNPVINFVDSKDPSKQQSGQFVENDTKEVALRTSNQNRPNTEQKLTSWQDTVSALYPIKIDRFSLHNGAVHFRNFDADPKVNIYLTEIDLTALNLTNNGGDRDSLASTVEMRAKAMDNAVLSASATVNALAQDPFFDLNAKLQRLDLRTLNSFTKYYAYFDFNAGQGEMVSEIAMKDKKFKGYVKPLFYGVDIFDWKQDVEKDKDNPLVALWESVVGGASDSIKHQRKDQLGAVVPIEGDLSKSQANLWVVMVTTLRNGFVSALIPDFENNITIESVNKVKAPSGS